MGMRTCPDVLTYAASYLYAQPEAGDPQRRELTVMVGTDITAAHGW